MRVHCDPRGGIPETRPTFGILARLLLPSAIICAALTLAALFLPWPWRAIAIWPAVSTYVAVRVIRSVK